MFMNEWRASKFTTFLKVAMGMNFFGLPWTVLSGPSGVHSLPPCIGRLPLSRNWSDIRNVTEDVEGEDLMQKIKDASFSLDGILKVY